MIKTEAAAEQRDKNYKHLGRHFLLEKVENHVIKCISISEGGQCLLSKKKISAPVPAIYSQMFSLEFKCYQREQMWVLVSPITESGYILSVSVFQQE